MLPFPKPVPAAATSDSAVVSGELAAWLVREIGPASAARGGGDARDEILRALAQRFYPGVPVSTQAARIHLLAVAYAIANRPSCRMDPHCPPQHRGRPEEYLWAAFKSGASMPIAPRELRRILLGIGDHDG